MLPKVRKRIRSPTVQVQLQPGGRAATGGKDMLSARARTKQGTEGAQRFVMSTLFFETEAESGLVCAVQGTDEARF